MITKCESETRNANYGIIFMVPTKHFDDDNFDYDHDYNDECAECGDIIGDVYKAKAIYREGDESTFCESCFYSCLDRDEFEEVFDRNQKKWINITHLKDSGFLKRIKDGELK